VPGVLRSIGSRKGGWKSPLCKADGASAPNFKAGLPEKKGGSRKRMTKSNPNWRGRVVWGGG